MWYSPVKCGYGWVWRGGSDFFFSSAGTEGVIPTPLPRITLACWEKIANAWHKEICSLLLHSSADICIFESESDVTYDQVWWPILGICALHFTHPKCTHTAVNTHREHTPGAVGGSVPCSRAPQSWYWGWREHCTFTPPTYNSCRPETQTRNLSITSPTL